MEEDRRTIQEIKKYLVGMLIEKYGYCGVAESPDDVMLNSGDNILIRISAKEEIS